MSISQHFIIKQHEHWLRGEARVLKFILQLCSYDPTLYNGHSFRSGAATSAGKALVEDHMIKILGRWSSDSYV
jgi:hypothetical protein